MAKKRFQIGDKEKHTIDVDYSSWSNAVEVLVDGRELFGSDHMGRLGGIGEFFKFHFDVGESEKHTISLALGGFSIDLHVDGDKVPAEGESAIWSDHDKT